MVTLPELFQIPKNLSQISKFPIKGKICVFFLKPPEDYFCLHWFTSVSAERVQNKSQYATSSKYHCKDEVLPSQKEFRLLDPASHNRIKNSSIKNLFHFTKFPCPVCILPLSPPPSKVVYSIILAPMIQKHGKNKQVSNIF